MLPNRNLFATDLMVRKPAQSPEFTRQYRINRLTFALVHWNLGQWSIKLLTDQSLFCLQAPDSRLKFLKRAGERCSKYNIVPKLWFNDGSIIVLGWVSAKRRRDFVLINRGAINVHRFIVEILQNHVVLYHHSLTITLC